METFLVVRTDLDLTRGILTWSEDGRDIKCLNVNERIEINPRVCGGQPVIRGTRISIATLLEQLAQDESWNALLSGYPELNRDDIQAALAYARDSILNTQITALEAA
jgi:uncharacterized protein (DUF433 family)